MANRDNHYEAAFEEYLRLRRTAYMAVDEARRCLSGAASLKSLDFIVPAGGGGGWLVDVKGRAFPAGAGRQYWRNWSTEDDPQFGIILKIVGATVRVAVVIRGNAPGVGLGVQIDAESAV